MKIKALSDRQVVVWCSGFAACYYYWYSSKLVQSLLDMLFVFIPTLCFLLYPVLFFSVWERRMYRKK